MAIQQEIGSAEVSDDESDIDSISITSTVLSEQKNEYPLEAILAEAKFGGVTKYLVKWEGYDENRCTWEPRSMFQDGEDSTFHQWETQKLRISRGLIKPFNVPAFKKRVDAWLQDIEQRKARRRAKRQRLGIPVSPIEEESQEGSSDSQADEEEDEEPKVVERRSSLKRRADSVSKSSDESQAVDTGSSDETVPRPQWTSKEEGALMQGLRSCKSPDWARILDMHKDTLKNFEVRDLEIAARRIIASFRESGKDVPQELRGVADQPPIFKKRVKEKLPKPKNASREQSVDKAGHGSDTDDSLLEELSNKQEAKKKRRMQRSDASKRIRGAEEKESTRSRDGSRSQSATPKPAVAPISNSKPEGQQSARSSAQIHPSGTLPKFNKRPVDTDQGKQDAASAASRPQASQASPTSRPGPVAATAPMMAAPRPGPHRPQPKPKSQMGGTGKGPMRASANNVIVTKKPKRHAEGADVLSNWEARKMHHGNSSMAPKKLDTAKGPEKVYDKHSLRRRAVKKGRTEPAPDMTNLQLIDPKDGKAVKKVSIAVPNATSNKSAFEMIRESREQAAEGNAQAFLEAEPDEMAWVGTVEEELAATSHVEPRNVAPVAPAMSTQTMNPRLGAKDRTMSDAGSTKRPKLTLQHYSKRLQPELSSNPSSAAIDSGPPPSETPTNDLSALRLTSPTAGSVLSVLQPAGSVSSRPPTESENSLGLLSLYQNGASSPPNQTFSPPVAPSSDTRPVPPGEDPRLKDPQPSDLSRLARKSPVTEECPHASNTETATGRPIIVRNPSAPQAMMYQGPPLTGGAPIAADGVTAPGANNVIWSFEKDEIYGNIIVGPLRRLGRQLGPVRFRGFNIESRRRLLANKTAPKENLFWLSSLCTAADYKSRFHTGSSDPLFWPGQIVPYSFNLADIDELSQLLKLSVSGGLFLCKDFTLLFYPPDSEDWSFIDEQLPNIPPIGLRCIMRTPIQHSAKESSDETLEVIRRNLDEKGKKFTYVADEPVINAVMRNLYDIDYQRLVRQPTQAKSQADHKFFMIFPKERRAEQDLVTHFLDANGATEIYSHDEDKHDGVWEYFYRNVKDGIIIAHLTFWRFHHLPNLAKLMRSNTVFWGLTLRKAERTSKSHLVRLFPHGCMLLLTDSLFLLQPLEAVRILTWYRARVFNEKPNSTWKIITRPNIRRFLLNCSKERKLDEEGRRFVQIYEQIAFLLDPEDLYDWEADEPKEEAPIYCMPKIKSFNTKVGRRVEYNKDLNHAALARNDDVLADFFAGWANVHMESYRRFHIICGFGDEPGRAQRERWAENWSYVEVFTPAAFYKRNGIPEQATLDVEAVKKHKATMNMLKHQEQEAEESIRADEAEHKAKMVVMEKEWRGQLERSLKLKEVYEGLMGSGGVEEVEYLSENGVVGMDKRKKEEEEGDGWSDDGSSGTDVEMGEVKGDGDGDEDMVDVATEGGSEVESWGLGESEESSGSESG